MTLAISLVKTTPPENHNMPHFMMQLPFRLIVIAPTSSGKSTMIHNILSKSHLIINKFLKIIYSYFHQVIILMKF